MLECIIFSRSKDCLTILRKVRLMKKILLTAMLCVVLAFGLTGCGGSSSSSSSSSTPLYSDTNNMVEVQLGEEVDEGLEAYASIKLPGGAKVLTCEYYTYNAADEFTEGFKLTSGTVAEAAKKTEGKDAVIYGLVMATDKGDGIDIVANSWWASDDVKKLTSADGSSVECCYYLEDGDNGFELESGQDYKNVKKLYLVMDIASPDGERGLSLIYDNTEVIKSLGPDKTAEAILKTINFKL